MSDVAREICVGDAVRYKPMGVIVRLQQIDGPSATVMTPSRDEYSVLLANPEKVEMNSLELAHAFLATLDGARWGGWNEAKTMPVDRMQ